MLVAICTALGFVSGLSLAVGFIIGFKTVVKYRSEGKLIGRVELVDPIQMTDRRVRELEEEEREEDAV